MAERSESKMEGKLAIKRCASKTMRQVIYTKGWSEGRKPAGERMKVAAKKGSVVTTENASIATNDQR